MKTTLSKSNQEKDTLRFPLEATLTERVRKWLDVQPDVAWYKASDRYQMGVSDCIICCGGIFVAAELKADAGTASPQQNLFIKEILHAGGIAGVCYTLREVKNLISAARERQIKC